MIKPWTQALWIFAQSDVVPCIFSQATLATCATTIAHILGRALTLDVTSGLSAATISSDGSTSSGAAARKFIQSKIFLAPTNTAINLSGNDRTMSSSANQSRVRTISALLARATSVNFTDSEETSSAISEDIVSNDLTTMGNHFGTIVLVVIGVHIAGICVSFWMDRSRREAFQETRQCYGTRLRLERENQNQVTG